MQERGIQHTCNRQQDLPSSSESPDNQPHHLSQQKTGVSTQHSSAFAGIPWSHGSLPSIRVAVPVPSDAPFLRVCIDPVDPGPRGKTAFGWIIRREASIWPRISCPGTHVQRFGRRVRASFLLSTFVPSHVRSICRRFTRTWRSRRRLGSACTHGGVHFDSVAAASSRTWCLKRELVCLHSLRLVLLPVLHPSLRLSSIVRTSRSHAHLDRATFVANGGGARRRHRQASILARPCIVEEVGSA